MKSTSILQIEWLCCCVPSEELNHGEKFAQASHFVKEGGITLLTDLVLSELLDKDRNSKEIINSDEQVVRMKSEIVFCGQIFFCIVYR